MTEVLESIDELQGVFDDVAADFSDTDFSPILDDWLIRMEDLHSQYFQSEVGPSGDAWQELAQATIDRKGHDAILIDSGKLSESLIGGTSDAIRDVFDEGAMAGLSFGTSVEYAIFHQEGLGVPQREHVGLSEPVVDVLAEEAADFQVQELVEV